MRIAILCPRCGYEVPEHASCCPKCGYRVEKIRRPLFSSTDFRIWEGDPEFSVVSPTQERPSKAPSPRVYYTKKRTEQVSPSYQTANVCKCLGSIEGMTCGTYYFVSSVKDHGGCARRDCSNSRDNDPEIVIGWGERKPVGSKKDYTALRVFLGIIGFIILIAGIAEESPAAFLGTIFFIVAVIPYGSERRKDKKVTFQLVRKDDIPKGAKDPWKQKNIW